MVCGFLTELKKQRDPGKFLAAFEPKNRHYQALKRMLKAYTTALDARHQLAGHFNKAQP